MDNRKKVESLCERQPSDNLRNLDEIIDAYIMCHRDRAACYLRFFARQPSLEKAVEFAALAKLPGGKRHPHQRRIPQALLQESRNRLSNAKVSLQSCQSFAQLHEVVEQVIGSIKGIGELTVYDTSVAIGAYLRLAPELIYLHRGTRGGLKAPGIYRQQKTIAPESLPEPFGRLQPHEIEDCLCIYKEDFSGTPT